MVRIFFLATMLFSLALSKASAQSINGVKLSELNAPYLEIRAFKQEFGNKVLVQLEYGQRVVDDRKASLVKDEEGKNMEFNSALDFISRMKAYGYELLTAYGVTFRDDTIYKYYVLKRKD